MKLKIEIDMDNDAFQDGQRAAEITRILKAAACAVAYGARDVPLTDINGNTVGRVTVEE